MNVNNRFICNWFMVSKSSDFYSNLVEVPFTFSFTSPILTVTESGGSFQRYGWAASFTTYSQFTVDTSKYLFLDVIVKDKTSSGYLADPSNYFERVFITLSDDRQYEITPNASYNADTNEYTFRFVQKIFTEYDSVHVDEVVFYCNVPSGSQGWAKYDIDFQTSLTLHDVTDTDLTGQILNEINTATQQVVSSINGQTQEIKDSIDASTDEITGAVGDAADDIIANDNENAEKTHDFLENIFKSLGELPGKIWQYISDGLKSLFVPDEQEMVAYKDKWDELLAERFGAVYQAASLIVDSWSDVQESTQTHTIDMPEVTIPLPEGNKFSFGGFAVQIVPSGFNPLVISVKSAIGIVCTFLFINGLRKRYDEVMGVEQ